MVKIFESNHFVRILLKVRSVPVLPTLSPIDYDYVGDVIVAVLTDICYHQKVLG